MDVNNRYGQYRLAILTRNLDKMSKEKLNKHLRTADTFLRDMNH